MSAKRILRQASAPEELAAGERAWAVVRAAYQTREPVTQPQRRGPVAVGLAVALTIGAVALSPAGATVGRLISHALGIQHASPALSSLPASGRLLLSDRAGTWTVAADGSARRLGSWPQASWSPHGRYLAIANGDQLAAIDPRGITQWTLTRPAVSDPRWFSPSGYRIAYLSAGQLRVVAGDGTGDHRVAPAVASVAPAWRPDHPYQLAYLTRRGTLVVRDGDSGQILWSSARARDATRLEWSGDGRDLLALSPTAARVFNARGELASSIAFGAGEFAIDGALSPGGSLLALVLGGRTDEVVLARPSAPRSSPRRVLVGAGLRQVLWSPDGHWLLISWPAADQLVFRRITGGSRTAAVSHIAQQFGRSGEFPELEGWCCTTRGH
jgi:hypothetical protein